MTTPTPADLVARAEQLLQSEAAKSRKEAVQRRHSAEVWRSSLIATEEDMANVVASRPISKRAWAKIEQERKESAERDDRIAVRDDARAEVFEAAAQSVAALAQALQQAAIDNAHARLTLDPLAEWPDESAMLLARRLWDKYHAQRERAEHAEGEVRRLTDQLQIARGALADIACSADLTPKMMRNKAERIYKETEVQP